ncbi:MAG: hypothetical protein POELPBGB_01069 [Bacteroidia bacterium]|nr:hypothetical protein [Bacteroidia bacterium]
MITSAEFNTLSLHDKGDMLWAKGRYFDERVTYGEAVYKFYLLYDFVVEVEYPVEENRIVNICGFSTDMMFVFSIR